MVVREDSLTIFGFLDEDEKQVFEIVQTASGVGPKVAQAIVAVMSPDDVRRAITTEDVKALTRVPGIGQKGAQRIILELKDRIGPPVGVHHPAAAAAPATDAVARPGAAGPRRAGLVGQGVGEGGRGRRPRRRRRPPTSAPCCAPPSAR